MMEVSKKDWKLFREKIAGWQEAYMARLVQEYIEFLSGDEAASTKFWELEKKIKEDKRRPGVLLRMEKSNMVYDLVALMRDEVISFNDLEEFSDKMKEYIIERARRY